MFYIIIALGAGLIGHSHHRLSGKGYQPVVPTVLTALLFAAIQDLVGNSGQQQHLLIDEKGVTWRLIRPASANPTGLLVTQWPPDVTTGENFEVKTSVDVKGGIGGQTIKAGGKLDIEAVDYDKK